MEEEGVLVGWRIDRFCLFYSLAVLTTGLGLTGFPPLHDQFSDYFFFNLGTSWISGLSPIFKSVSRCRSVRIHFVGRSECGARLEFLCVFLFVLDFSIGKVFTVTVYENIVGNKVNGLLWIVHGFFNDPFSVDLYARGILLGDLSVIYYLAE